MLLIVLALASVAAFLLSSVAGGGAGLLLMPMLALLLPAASAPAALSLGTVTSSSSRLIALRRHIRWDVVRWFLPTALPAVVAGSWLLTLFPPIYVQLLLGLFLVGNLPAVLRRAAPPDAPLPVARRPERLLLVGTAAGLLSGFTGAVGLLFNRFYYRLDMDKEQIVATRAANEVLLHVVKLILYASFGLFNAQAVFAGAVVAAGALAASAATPVILRLVHEGLFRRIGLAAMVCAGVSMTATASAQVIAVNRANALVSVEPNEVELTTRWRSQQISAEIDSVEGLVVEIPARIEQTPPDVRAAIVRKIGRGQIVSLEKAISLSGRHWEVEFKHDRRLYEFNLPRADS